MPAITPIVFEATTLLISLIKMAKESKELSKQEMLQIKAKLDREFQNFPDWDDL